MTIAKFINEVGFKVREGDVKKVNDSIKSIKSTATKLLGAIGIGFSLTKINALVEEFGAANKQITSAVGEMENMDAVQGQVLQKANARPVWPIPTWQGMFPTSPKPVLIFSRSMMQSSSPAPLRS